MKVNACGKSSVLMVAYYFPPQNASGAARAYRFFKYLPQFGHTAAVISFGGPDEEIIRKIGLRGMFFRAARILQGVSRRYDYKMPWLPAALAQAEEILSTNPVRVVFSTHPPVATHLVALRLKRKYGLKWIADFRDPLSGNSVFKKRFTGSLDSVLEKAILGNCDVAIANTEPLADLWRKRHPRWAGKIVTIWNGFDPEETLAALPLPARPYRLLAHVGELYGARKPTLLLESVERLLDNGSVAEDALRIRFVGPQEANTCAGAFENLRARGIVESNEVLVPRAEAIRETAQADYLLLLDLTGLKQNIQVPAKIFDYLRIGRPILAFTTKASPAEWILELSCVPHVCIYITDSPGEVDEKIRRFLDLPPDPTPYGSRFRELFDGVVQAQQFAMVVDKLNCDQS